MKPIFLNVLTASDLSAYYEDARSETSSGTSFDLESEPSLDAGGGIAWGCSWPHSQLATPPDSPNSSPLVTLSDKQEVGHDDVLYSIQLLFRQS
jgi:hypothetical protein